MILTCIYEDSPILYYHAAKMRERKDHSSLAKQEKDHSSLAKQAAVKPTKKKCFKKKIIPYILKDKHFAINVFTHVDTCQPHNHFNFRMFTCHLHGHLTISMFTH